MREDLCCNSLVTIVIRLAKTMGGNGTQQKLCLTPLHIALLGIRGDALQPCTYCPYVPPLIGDGCTDNNTVDSQRLLRRYTRTCLVVGADFPAGTALASCVLLPDN